MASFLDVEYSSLPILSTRNNLSLSRKRSFHGSLEPALSQSCTAGATSSATTSTQNASMALLADAFVSCSSISAYSQEAIAKLLIIAEFILLVQAPMRVTNREFCDVICAILVVYAPNLHVAVLCDAIMEQF